MESAMRIAFWASALLITLAAAIAAQADDSVGAVAGTSVTYTTEKSKTRIEITSESGRRYVIRAKRDATVSPGAKAEVRVIGAVKGSAIVLIDSYPSLPGGMSYCQAGQERFLRVISMAKKQAEETLRIKVESCRENLELASPGIEWRPESSTLRINWLLGPSSRGSPEERTIRLRADGTPDEH